MRLLITLTLALALTLSPLALAGHDEGCTPGVVDWGTVVDTGPAGAAGVERYYVHLFTPTIGPLFELWIYQESNGLDGLQRADEQAVTESCGHGGDTIIF